MPDVCVRLRRSLLMTPGNRPERLAKAAGCGADVLVFDLEDSVPPERKAQARGCVAQALRALSAKGPERCVRINGLDTPHAAPDLAALPLAHLDSIMVPKVESPDTLRTLDAQLAELEAVQGREQALELIVMLETPRGILRALSIADACHRTTALFFGSGDYTSALGAEVDDTTLLYPRSVVAAAAAAAGLAAIDAAYFLDVKDAAATRRDADTARCLGFDGKVVFHPNQVGPVNDVFTPDATALERARRIVAAYEAGLRDGRGTAVVDGVFVAVDLVPPARRLLARAAAIAARSGGTRP
ncbi:CoA ester lyase [Bordetella sp. BOR01]|uniref:HpcH/HpaI aldolase/citrate lyase family protein n=1 Tax=Bordetella sp. BOR01 TaxID=2854779 RepID=UPI001C478EA0|nr:CoA ester lyase [Bordetella sp. BOR01]MBV7484754.1 CoA ester lyase [Bordetella sp. BOR01]